jgi:DNA-directed RNA polymerase specialized sigma subunit
MKQQQIEQLNKKMEIADAIDQQIEDVEERTLLYARYVNGKSWEEIYDELHRSKSATHRIHASALRHFKVPD